MAQSNFQRDHVISGAFVFLLLGIFAVFSTLMVLLSAQLYRGTVADSQLHGDRRVAESFLMNAVRRSDAAGLVSVEEIGGVTALVFTFEGDFEDYETRIYCHEGRLREYFGVAGEKFDLSYGESICELASFEPTLEGGMLQMHLASGDGWERTLCAALRCGEVTP